MSSTFTTAFTSTDAHYVATKIAADLRQLKLFYGEPSESKIEDYLKEITEHLANGYLDSFEAGFKIAGTNRRVVTLRYEARSGPGLADDGAGRVYARADISGASWFSFLRPSAKFSDLSLTEQKKFKARMPIQRSAGEEPQDGDGYWVNDKNYSRNGGGTHRGSFRPV